MGFGSSDGGENVDDNDVGFVEISILFNAGRVLLWFTTM